MRRSMKIIIMTPPPGSRYIPPAWRVRYARFIKFMLRMGTGRKFGI